ncbi:MAG: hypothetical protein RMM10_11800 [Anaerolineae bacterium]|uniref:hypothetical protein n=1 Tax=Thermoflexus sp. TaxID=1969742 RepID=UPI0025FCE741|nr:hypothetical protein [Thermoflexus sp.]MCS7352181.1 hypothetical protein [Thermoflexus sp.]MDW8064150.1 hypothetical protein [Anaerolineae bacterium]MDW8181642.1 hypothetical protein [Anaerolineae bacterium]
MRRLWRRDQRGQSLVSFALAMVPFFLILLYLLYSGAYALFWSTRSRQAVEQALRAASYAGPSPSLEWVRVSPERRSLEAGVNVARDTGGRFYGVPIRWRVSLELQLRKWRFWGGPPSPWW